MKRLIAATLVAAIGVSLLTGCGVSNKSHDNTQVGTTENSSDKAKNKEVKMHVWCSKNDVDITTQMIESFKEANKGTDFGILKKVASGGEMSRIMLAVKAILAQYSKLPTLIFDEIDTGVSGEIAIRMGEIMKQMSQSMQIFAITHLPQIAAKGDAHFKVFKSTID
ncbi:MAG: hypothetical protein ACEQR7_09345, partial [Agathobacter rectalis]